MIRFGKLVGALVVALGLAVSGAWAHCGKCGVPAKHASAKSCCDKHAAGDRQECCAKHAAGQRQACCEKAGAVASAKSCCDKHAAGQRQACCEKHAAGQKQACCEKGASVAAATPACCAGSSTTKSHGHSDAVAAPATTYAPASTAVTAERGQLSPSMQNLMDKVETLRRRRSQ